MKDCIDAATLASYIDRMGLSLEERRRVEAHLARCPTCVELVANVITTLIEISKGVPNQWKG